MSATLIEPKAELSRLDFPIVPEVIDRWRAEFLPLTIAGLNDAKGAKAVREARLVVKKARCDVEARRKVLKADSLEYGRKVDAEAKRLTGLIDPIEQHLQEQEDRIAAEKARIDKAKAEAARQMVQARVDALAAVGCQIPFAVAEAMPEADFAAKLRAEEGSYKIRLQIEADEKAELERSRIEDAARREREAEELRAERERQAAERARLDAERAALEAERQKQDAAAAAERAKLDAERRAADQERARQEAEAKAKADAEAKQKADEEAARQRAAEAEAEAKRLESLRPDKDKLMSLARQLLSIPRLTLSTNAHDAADQAIAIVSLAARDIERLAEAL